MSRTKKTAINSITGLICSVVSSVLSFVLRALFIRLLGLEYAGINTLFGDILSILNLVDLGFNNAVLFRLYKTIADGDDDSTEMYLTLYRKICYIVGIIIGVLGLLCVPFLNDLVKEAPKFKEPLWSLYLIILLTSVVSHLVNYKSILLIAKQDRYISTIIQYACIFLRHGLQIATLVFFKNIYIYLSVSLLTTVIQGVWTGIASYKRFHLSWHSKKQLPDGEVKTITKDVGALSVYKLCRTIDSTIDTFLISKFIAVSITAVYGSTMMILNALHELLGVFNDGMLASVGDLNASGDKKTLLSVFFQTTHFTFLLYGICTATLVPLILPFTDWWIDSSLPQSTVFFMLLGFYMYGMGMNIATYRNSLGIFRKGWKRPAITAIFNLVFSLVLIQKIGLSGAIIGTILARVLTGTWYDPYIVLKYGMNSTPYKYYLRYISYFMLTAIASLINFFIGKMLPNADSLIRLILSGVVYLICASAFLMGTGFIFEEHKIVLERIQGIARNMFKNLRRKKIEE